MHHIVCIGNRLTPADDAGPRVFDRLQTTELPEQVTLTDGGLAGLELLGLVEGAERVVFVDQVTGFGPEGAVVQISTEEITDTEQAGERYGHASGLPFLLRCLPLVSDPPPEEVLIVGVEGEQVQEQSVEAAARLCLKLVHGSNGVDP